MKKELLRSLIYQVFVRDYSPEGTFDGVTKDLDRLKDLGVDILYLLPIYPIGVLNRKGSVGSPYSIQDYEKVDPAYGTMEDFKKLIEETHKRGMKLWIDVVYNHTSCDSVLSKRHPDWFYHDKDGNFGNKAGAWSDVIDLDHSKPELEEYLSNVLKDYVSMGVDGFRFDVASLIPASFFMLAKSKCQKINPDVTFLAEAVDTEFINYIRSLGFHAWNNTELMLEGIDAVYHYGSWQWLREFLGNDSAESLLAYRAAYHLEEANRPEEGIIMRAIENHDQKRIASYRKSESFTRNLIAYSFFTRGPGFLYNGEEDHAEHQLSLFEKEEIDWHHEKDYQDYVKKLIALKRRKENEGLFSSDMLPSEGKTLLIQNNYPDHKEYGFFNLDTKASEIKVPKAIVGKTLTDLLTGQKVTLGETLTLSLPLYLK